MHRYCRLLVVSARFAAVLLVTELWSGSSLIVWSDASRKISKITRDVLLSPFLHSNEKAYFREEEEWTRERGERGGGRLKKREDTTIRVNRRDAMRGDEEDIDARMKIWKQRKIKFYHSHEICGMPSKWRVIFKYCTTPANGRWINSIRIVHWECLVFFSGLRLCVFSNLWCHWNLMSNWNICNYYLFICFWILTFSSCFLYRGSLSLSLSLWRFFEFFLSFLSVVDFFSFFCLVPPSYSAQKYSFMFLIFKCFSSLCRFLTVFLEFELISISSLVIWPCFLYCDRFFPILVVFLVCGCFSLSNRTFLYSSDFWPFFLYYLLFLLSSCAYFSYSAFSHLLSSAFWPNWF